VADEVLAAWTAADEVAVADWAVWTTAASDVAATTFDAVVTVPTTGVEYVVATSS